jgi:hypothetical protein
MSFYASAKVKSLKLEKRTFYQSTDNNGVIFTFVTSSKSGTKKEIKMLIVREAMKRHKYNCKKVHLSIGRKIAKVLQKVVSVKLRTDCFVCLRGITQTHIRNLRKHYLRKNCVKKFRDRNGGGRRN